MRVFVFRNECNLTLSGDSTFSLLNGGKIIGSHITLSGSGSIKVIARSINETTYNNMFSAAEGYTLTSSGKKEEEERPEIHHVDDKEKPVETIIPKKSIFVI